MEAKDTVIKRQDINQYIFGDKVWLLIVELLQAQAEITGKIMYGEGFKAGQENEKVKHNLSHCEIHNLYYCDCCPDCFILKGIREVVDTVEKLYHNRGIEIMGVAIVDCIVIVDNEWQAQLKKWGIKE